MTGFDVLLDGHALSDVDAKILVEDVRTAPALQLTTVPLGGGNGCYVTRRRREALSVAVDFEVHERDPAARQAILDQVAAWCGGRVLTLPSSPGVQLRVVCTAYPAVSALKWTEKLTAVFTAYAPPMWEAEHAVTASAQGSTAELALHLPGTADTVLEAAVHNTATQLCQTMMIRTEAGTMTFENLGLLPGETLRIGHDEWDRLTVRIDGPQGERSAYACRTAASSDEAMLHPGRNQVQCAADQALAWRLSARGRWL